MGRSDRSTDWQIGVAETAGIVRVDFDRGYHHCPNGDPYLLLNSSEALALAAELREATGRIIDAERG
jgi:hypothetical protein